MSETFPSGGLAGDVQSILALADAVPQLVWMAEADGHIFWYNRRWFEYTGTTFDEMRGWGWQTVHDPEILPRVVEKWTAAIRSGDAFEMEFPLRRADGVFRWFLTRVNPVRGADGAVERWFGTNTDIEDQRRVQLELEEAKALLDTILDQAPVGLGFWDKELRYSRVNNALAEINGLPAEAHIGKTIPELLPGIPPEVFETFRRVLETGEPLKNVEVGGETPAAGEKRFWNVSYYPIRLRGETAGVGAVCEEISARKKIEAREKFLSRLDEAVRPLIAPEEITLTLARLLGEHLAADRCAYAAVEADENHFVITGNYTNGVESILGRYNFAQFGADVLRLMRENKPYVVSDAEADARLSESDRASYRQIEMRAVICVPLHKNERLAAAMAVHQKTARNWTPEEIELVAFVGNRFWESIERARLFQEAQEARRAAEQASRLKDEFLATVSHELRTPLNAILGWATMLRAGRDEENSRKAVEIIERNARTQAQLIDDLLDVSRIITGNLRLDVQPVEPDSFVEAALEAVRPAAESKAIRLQKIIDPQAPPMQGDSVRLRQVVWNLVSNAVRFTPKGGRVQVRLERINSHVEISVSDTGEGIAPEFLPYVFDRFRQADGTSTRRQGGLGLGLAIVRHIVELHGGTVTAESGGAGCGSTFVVRLPIIPVYQADAATPGAAANAKELPAEFSAHLDGLTVLVADDEADSRELLRAAIERCGARVLLAASADEAFRLLEESAPDVLVSDIGMPGRDGYDLIRRVRALAPESGGRVPAIALTAYARAADRVRALQSGFQAHVAKPVEINELLAVVATLAEPRSENPRN